MKFLADKSFIYEGNMVNLLYIVRLRAGDRPLKKKLFFLCVSSVIDKKTLTFLADMSAKGKGPSNHTYKGKLVNPLDLISSPMDKEKLNLNSKKGR